MKMGELSDRALDWTVGLGNEVDVPKELL